MKRIIQDSYDVFEMYFYKNAEGDLFVMEPLYAVILAAGKGKRMNSTKPKVLHQICGKPIVCHILEQLSALRPEKSIMIVGHQSEQVRAQVGDQVIYKEQEQQLGTAHAVLQAKEELKDLAGITLILNGDHPLFTKETLLKLVRKHREEAAAATILTACVEDPTGYGRVIRDQDGCVKRIVEHKDASEEERRINEINTGTFCFDNQKLFQVLDKVNNQNAQGEYYLPDVISIFKELDEKVVAEKVLNPEEALGVNDRVQLALAEKYMRQRIIRQHQLNGVSIVDPENTYIDADVVIGSDTVIEPGTFLRGKTKIGKNCHIGPQADLTDVDVEDEVSIRYAVISDSKIDQHTTVGPYVYIRPQTHLGKKTKIGCFVDLKKAQLGEGSKISHLAYVGDAKVGRDVNIGCGVVTVNYDGVKKHQTIIHDHAFIGCNVNLVAPVTIEREAYVAAGSTITDNIPERSLAIARERQTNKVNYVEKLWRKKNK